MSRLVAIARTKNASQYLVQLCKHWSHRFESSHTPARGMVALPFGRTDFEANDEALTITVEMTPAADAEAAKRVISEHLNRFAFREAPLAMDWSESA